MLYGVLGASVHLGGFQEQHHHRFPHGSFHHRYQQRLRLHHDVDNARGHHHRHDVPHHHLWTSYQPRRVKNEHSGIYQEYLPGVSPDSSCQPLSRHRCCQHNYQDLRCHPTQTLLLVITQIFFKLFLKTFHFRVFSDQCSCEDDQPWSKQDVSQLMTPPIRSPQSSIGSSVQPEKILMSHKLSNLRYDNMYLLIYVILT